MKIYHVKIDDGGGDEEWVEVEANTLIEATQKVWDEWQPTGWQRAVVGRDDDGWTDVDLSHTSRRP